MALLTKWNLSEACGSDILKFLRKICRDDVRLPTSVKQGHQLIDQMNVPHISFKKLPIMTYMEETYYLHHRQIFEDRKSTRLNSSHGYISYAVFCLKKKRKVTTAPPVT